MERLAELARTGELATLVLNALPGVGVLVYDPHLRYVLATGDALTRHGFDPPSLLGRPIAEVLPSPLHETLVPHYRSALRGEHVHVFYRSFDGSSDYLIDVAPLRHGDQEVIGGVVFSRDVTALVHAGVERYSGAVSLPT